MPKNAENPKNYDFCHFHDLTCFYLTPHMSENLPMMTQTLFKPHLCLFSSLEQIRTDLEMIRKVLKLKEEDSFPIG